MSENNHSVHNQVLVNEQTQKQQQQHINKVKKCHGNRRLQRFRRKCRKQGMNNDTIQSLIVHQQANKSFHNHHQIATDSTVNMDESFDHCLDNDNSKSSKTEVKSELQGIQNINSDDQYFLRS